MKTITGVYYRFESYCGPVSFPFTSNHFTHWLQKVCVLFGYTRASFPRHIFGNGETFNFFFSPLPVPKYSLSGHLPVSPLPPPWFMAQATLA